MMSLLTVGAGLLTLVASSLPVDHLQLPEGFSISVYADNIEDARQMALGDKGTVFVGSRTAGKVYALVDTNGDGRIDDKVDKKYTIATGLNMPSGIAFRDGSLYVAALSKILRYDNIESSLENPPDSVVVTNKLPSDKYHGWKYLGFDPDGYLYVPVGVPCNACITHDKRHGTILRLDVKTGKIEIFAKGIRNSVGFDWDPKTGELWFTDNGRDWLGDDLPPDELNRAYRKGLHFGFPYVHGNNVYDPEFKKEQKLWKEKERLIKPELELGAHVAPLGMTFYRGEQFPENYKNRIVIAEHGSWNRSKKTGYRLITATLGKYKIESVEPFVTGWLKQSGDADDGMHWGACGCYQYAGWFGTGFR